MTSRGESTRLMTTSRGEGAGRRLPRRVPPEAARWLTVDLGSSPVQVVVAGVTGGVGTTTLTALVARCLAMHRPATRQRPSVVVLDHDGGTAHERSGAPGAGVVAVRASGGGLSSRPSPEDATPAGARGQDRVDADVLLRCLGAQALNPGPTLLDDPTVVAVVVAPWHADGLALAGTAADRLGAYRTVVVPVDVTRAQTSRAGLGLPWDRALTAPGEITERALSAASRRAVIAVSSEVIAAARRVAVLTAG